MIISYYINLCYKITYISISCSHIMNNMDTDNNDMIHEWKKRKVRKEHKDTLIRKLKIQGKAHVKHRKPDLVPEKKIGPDCHCKRYQCFQKVDENSRKNIFDSFYNLPSKNEQDSHLSGLITMSSVMRRRPRVGVVVPGSSENDSDEIEEGVNLNSATFTYKIRLNGEEIKICMRAFLSLHSITRKRLRRIQSSLVHTGSSPQDKCGLHNNHYKKIPKEARNLAEVHIRSLAVRQSHYSRRHNPRKYYLHEGLHSVTQLYQLFLDEYQIHAVPISIYRIIFRSYNISFGKPYSDTCASCDSFSHDLEHLSLVSEFCKLRTKYSNRAKNKKIKCISIDFMQNLPLPNINTSIVFYCRQLWYYVFGIHNYADDSVNLYVYDETEGKKGCNDVATMLFHYLRYNKKIDKPLIIISDSCPGQNKNYVFIKFLYILVHVFHMLTSITHVFSVRGHTYLPNDRDFALVEKNKKQVLAETPTDWTNHIKKCRTNPSKFVVNEMEHVDFFNIQENVKKYFFKKPVPQIKLRNVRMLQINTKFKDIRVKYRYNGPWFLANIRNKLKLPVTVDFIPVYENKIKLHPSKVNDLKKLENYVQTVEGAIFFQNIFRDNNTVLHLKKPEEEVTITDGPDDWLDFEILLEDDSSGTEDI